MKFLIDQCLSPSLAIQLSSAGHETSHARELGLSSAEDRVVLEYAEKHYYCIVTADSDFAAILTLGEKTKPSCIVFRGEFSTRAQDQSRLLLTSFAELEHHISSGAIITITDRKIRVRELPVSGK